jgi:hypothetical protein
MTRAIPNRREPAVEPLDEAVDHVRGSRAGRLIIEYGDYECPYSRQAFRQIEQVEKELGGRVRFAFRHFPLTEIHPHALVASAAAEAAAMQGRFWEMHELLFHRQKALDDDDLRRYAAGLGLDVSLFDRDRAGSAALGVSAGTWKAASRRARYWALPPCSSTASCTEEPTRRLCCLRRWPDERDLHAHR